MATYTHKKSADAHAQIEEKAIMDSKMSSKLEAHRALSTAQRAKHQRRAKAAK